MHKIISSDESVVVVDQHEKPCSDCPWSRDSFPGWLGPHTAEEWINLAHSDAIMSCHARKFPDGRHDICQCAGAAIFRRNICKLSRNKDALQLDSDRESVFSNDMEFNGHHEKSDD